MRLAILLMTLMPALAVDSSRPARAQFALPKAVPPTGDTLFGQQCGACHSIVPGETRVGPSLAGILGRKAGSLPGFEYSVALKKSDLVWTPANLDHWLSGSVAFVPGTAMTYSQSDAAKRRAIIDYLGHFPSQ